MAAAAIRRALDESGISTFHDVASISPGDAFPADTLLFLRMDRPSDALSASERWLTQASDNEIADLVRAESLVRLQRFDAALAAATRAIELAPEQGRAW